MRKSLSTAFRTYLTGKTAKSFARCWKVTCTNGVIRGFTTHTRDLTIDGVYYLATRGLSTSSVKSSEGFAVDNLTISAFLGSQDEVDILAGLYDGAFVEIFIVNFFNLGMGRLTEKVGFVGEISRSEGVFQAEIRGLSDMLRTKIGRVYSAACDARLGDSRCKATPLRTATIVNGLISSTSFRSTDLLLYANSRFSLGNVTFLSGQNAGVKRDIEIQLGDIVELFLPPPFPLAVSDGLLVEEGCDKSKHTCLTKFNNVINFRGFDHVPVLEQVFDSPVSLTPQGTICASDDPTTIDTPVGGDGGASDGGGEGGSGDSETGGDSGGSC